MLGSDYLSLKLVRLNPGEKWLADNSSNLVFLFPQGGSGEFANRTGAYPLATSDVLVFDSVASINISASRNGDLAFWWFSLCSEHLFPLFATHELCLVQEVTDLLKPGKHYPASTPLAAECHKFLRDVPPQFNLDHRSQLLRIAASILAAEFKNTQGHRSGFVSMDDHLTQVFEKLSLDEILNLSVGDLSNRFGCSRRHLNRLFHQLFGFSVASLRMEMRLLKAVALLRDPQSKVIRIAEQCGFNHLGLFNTCFKRRFGTTPGEWRKNTPPPAKESHTAGSVDDNCRLRAIGLCPWAEDAPGIVNSAERKTTATKALTPASDGNRQIPPITTKGVRPAVTTSIAKPEGQNRRLSNP